LSAIAEFLVLPV